MADIRQTGFQSYRDLQKQNAEPFNPETASAEDWYRQLKKKDYNKYSDQPTEYVGIQAAEAGYGDSQYDEGLTSASQLQDLGDIRYENQPWYDVLANGVGKMFGKAGTTFISSLVGLPYGLFQVGKGLVEGQDNAWSNIWDNDVTQGLSNVDKWMEENMTNYQSQAQQEDPTFRFGDLNWWADNVITNAGFTLGAAASMAVGAGSLGLMSKALGFVNDVGKTTKGGAALLSSLFSATGEGMIEAKQGVEERNKLEMQRLNDALTPEYNALEMQKQQIDSQYAATGDYDTYKLQMGDYLAQKQELDNRKAAGEQQIIESGQRMGNAILGLNQVLLTAGDLIQFGKGAVKSFDAARHAAEVSSKTAKPFGMSAVRVSENLKDGYKTVGKTFGKAMITPKNMIKEGSEEMNQQWIQSGAGTYYNEKDVNDYWKARLDPEAYRDTTEGLHTLGSALSQGFKESWGDKDQYEQFLIGAMTGAGGIYMPTKIFNQDKTKSRLDPRRYGEWSGGAWQDISEYNQKARQFEENIDDLNKILASEDFPARVMSMTGHTYTEKEKDAAVEGDDKKAWKDADDKQMVHDIQAFLRAGKLDDLRTIYNEIGSQLSDEDVQNIIKSTTKEITAEEDKQNFVRQADEQIAAHQRRITELQQQAQDIGDSQEMLEGSERMDYQTAVRPELEKIFADIDTEYDAINSLEQQKDSYVGQKYYEGAYVDREGNQTVSDDEIKQTVKHNSEELNRKLDSYLESIDYVNRRTNGALTKDQEDNLAYIHNLGKESNLRMQKIMADVRKQLPKTFLLKTSKTPEQLTKENASSDLVFTKDENTKEGYVEVDTSTMNNASFADFFQREVMRGGNIRPEFAETADEKAAREEEEKNLPEAERKKKARERASKKWQDALKQMQDDAEEQWDVNWRNLVDNFMDNYKKDNNATLDETIEAFSKVKQNLQDASNLFDQAGEFQRTLMEYMANPGKVDEDKAKAEETAQKAANEQQAKSKFAGKSSKEIKQDMIDGKIDFGELDDFINAGGIEDEGLIAAQQEAKKAQEGNQKAAALKQHILESDAEPDIKEAAMAMVDQANMQAENPEDINIDSEAFRNLPIDMVDPDADPEAIARKEMTVHGVMAKIFNDLNEDEVAQNDIPASNPEMSDAIESEETGHDATTKTKPEVVAPVSSSPPKAASEPLPKNPLTEGAIGTIISETSKLYDKPNTNGTWRSTTTRHPYGKSTGTYHETLTDKDSIQYKRSKAIWEYLNAEGAFDRQDNASADRIKPNDTIHFMVKFFLEIAGEDPRAMTTEDRNASLVIFMLNDNGEVIGDLPLAEFEPSYRAGNPTQQVKDLMSLQNKLFDAYMHNYALKHDNEAIADNTLIMDGRANLNLTFDGSKKPLLSKVKQVMKGVVPYRYGEINTLNEVTNSIPFELGVSVTGTTIAKKRGDKTQHKEIIMPHVGTTGQPYLLLPTPSGEQIAVPFYMKPFDANQHRETEFYKILSNAMNTLLVNNSYTTPEQKEAFNKAMDVVEGLLQVKAQEGVRTVVVGKDNVTFNFQSLTDPNQKITLTAPSASGNNIEITRLIIDQLSGTPINVSLQFLNDTIEAGGRKANYNNVIGEIADVNLPKATNHTVNGWFTVELAPSAGIKPSKKVTPKTTGTVSMNIGGENIEINTDTLTAYNPITGEVIEDNEEVNLTLAQIKAAKPQYQDKDRIQISINGELRTYDTKEGKFVKNAPIKKEDNTNDEIAQYIRDISAAKNSKELATISQAATTANMNGTLSGNGLLKVTELVNAARIELISKESSSSLPSNTVGFTQPQTSSTPISQAKTLEQIEVEMKQKKIVGRQTKDAWAAIPTELKMKLANEGQPLQLSFNGKTMVVSLSDREGLIQGLTQANMAAKAGNLKVSEAPKPMEKSGAAIQRENEQAARRWLAKNLPTLSSEERTQFVKKLSRMGDDAGKYWGSYRGGVIQIQINAPMGTVYHEAFHYVMDMVLSPEERQQILDIAKEEYGLSGNWMAEERLANDFRRYAMDENAEGFTGKLRRFFRKLKDLITRYNRISDATINQLFWKINNGELNQKATQAESFEDNQQRVLREIRNVQKEKLSWRNLSADTKKALASSGLSEAAYNEMSLEEKEQYVRCRG